MGRLSFSITSLVVGFISIQSCVSSELSDESEEGLVLDSSPVPVSIHKLLMSTVSDSIGDRTEDPPVFKTPISIEYSLEDKRGVMTFSFEYNPLQVFDPKSTHVKEVEKLTTLAHDFDTCIKNKFFPAGDELNEYEIAVRKKRLDQEGKVIKIFTKSASSAGFCDNFWPAIGSTRLDKDGKEVQQSPIEFVKEACPAHVKRSFKLDLQSDELETQLLSKLFEKSDVHTVQYSFPRLDGVKNDVITGSIRGKKAQSADLAEFIKLRETLGVVSLHCKIELNPATSSAPSSDVPSNALNARIIHKGIPFSQLATEFMSYVATVLEERVKATRNYFGKRHSSMHS